MEEIFGKGLDVGTSRLMSSWYDNGKEIVKSLRDCYLEIKDEDVDFIEKHGDWKLTTINGRSFALADDSLTVSNWLKTNVQRPMANGVLNPTDDDAFDILEELINKLLGPPRYQGEICVCSIPADSYDGEIDTVAHKGAVKQIVTKLGYSFYPINEGYATLLALNPKSEKDGQSLPFTGIGISFGGGMSNLCLSYKTKPIMQMSVSRSGDWIDAMVAKTFGKDPATNQYKIKPNQVTTFKESYFSFNKKYSDDELNSFNFKTPERKKFFQKMMTNLELYYENLMEFIAASFSLKFKEDNISIENALEIVISGGTSTPTEFESRFNEILKNSEMPIVISGVRKAENTLISTVSGALIWAINLENKKKKLKE